MRKQIITQMLGFAKMQENNGIMSNEEFKAIKNRLMEQQQEPKRQSSPEQLLTRRKAAELLSVSTRHLDRLISGGFLETRKLGSRAVRIPSRAVEMLIENGVNTCGGKV